MALAVDITHRRSALKAALARPRPALDRIPHLREILAGACEQLGETLAPLAPDLSASLLSLDEGRCRDHLGIGWHSELCAVLVSGSPACEVLVHMGMESVGAFVVQALGGSNPVDLRLWPRARPSRIEMAMAGSIAEAAARVLNDAFRQTGVAVTLQLATIGDDQTVTASARDNVPGIAVRIGLDKLSTTPWISLLLPLSLISPFATKLAAVPKPKTTAVSFSDPMWRRRIESELAYANINVAAVLETRETTLEALSNLKVGDVLTLDATADSYVTLESQDVPLYACELGKQDGSLTVRVTSKLSNGPAAPAAAAGTKPQSVVGGKSA